MKKIIKYMIVPALMMIYSCNKFLDVLPDKRAELNNPKKLSELLVSAYPYADPMMLLEHRTDNVVDNGKKYKSGSSTMIKENYFWEDCTTSEIDSPERIWTGCYSAIAAANQVLETIKANPSPDYAKAQKGEALLCRAYAHFMLVNVFSKPYNPESANADLGIPYVFEPESVIGTKYERGTVASVYENIEKDIEEGFPLIDDNSYSVAKYHFNKKAAAAFATRFYLYYGKFRKAVDYADIVLGANPVELLRDFRKYVTLTQPSEWRDLFISPDEQCNLLLIPLYSIWGRTYTNNRYGHDDKMLSTMLYRSPGPWGGMLGGYDLLFGRSGYPVKSQPKYDEIFEVTDETAQTGSPHVVQMAFTTDETLLNRAEAKVMLGEYDAAAEDLSAYYVSKQGNAADADKIVKYYTDLETKEKEKLESDELKPWHRLVKPLHSCFKIEEDRREKMIQAVLHVRRIETIFSGMRWYDIRRFGIEVIHPVEDKEPLVLGVNDYRRTIQIPESVISAGLQANPKK